MLDLGLIVNPVAGIGGAAGLKGSDGAVIQAEARRRGYSARAEARCSRFLAVLVSRLEPAARARLRWLTWPGSMGAGCLANDFPNHRIPAGATLEDPPRAADTRRAARALADAGADLLLFVGGDGTARDVLDAVGRRLPVLGIPAGVKMHSGVFATTPEAAAEIVLRLMEGGIVALVDAEVRDVDEAALRAGTTGSRFYGELTVPAPGGFLQHTKEGGREREDLALLEIVADLEERIAAFTGPVILGPGGTLAALKEALGGEPTLLGVDVRYADGRWLRDADAVALAGIAVQSPALVVSFTRGQGFLFGRGNQQLSPALIQSAWPDRVWVAGTRTKLASLEGRPLLVDTDDPALDAHLTGLAVITAGYHDHLLYAVATHA